MSDEHKPGTEEVHDRNKDAPHLNPTQAGVRSGNPVFDPKRSGKRAPEPTSPQSPSKPPK
jgi:hypothetical protein